MLTDNQKKFLASSAEFNRRINDCPELDLLEAQAEDPQRDADAVLSMLGDLSTVCGQPVQPVTPAMFSFLWAIGSPFAHSKKNIAPEDVEVFFFLLSNSLRKVSGSVDDLKKKAHVFCSGLDLIQAAKDMQNLIRDAFDPLNMLPSTNTAGTKDDKEPRFDAPWLADITSVVARMTGETARVIAYEYPLSACYYYWLQRVKENDRSVTIRRYTSGEIAKEILLKVEQMGEDFCKEQGVV